MQPWGTFCGYSSHNCLWLEVLGQLLLGLDFWYIHLSITLTCLWPISLEIYFLPSILKTTYMQMCSVLFSSVAQLCLTLCDPMNRNTPGLPVHHQLRVHSNERPSSRWCHLAISSSVIPFSFYPQSLPASESFPMSQLFAWGGQSTGVSASASFLPKNIQDWSPLGWTGWISLQSKGLSRGFSSTTVQKHQFFGAQLSSQSNSHIHTWPLEKP